MVSDSLENPRLILPEEMILLIEFMKQVVSYSGSNTELAERFNSFTGKSVTSKGLKQMMNRWHYALEEHGVRFENHRSNGHRFVEVCYSPAGDESAVSDGNLPCGETCVPFVTCDPVRDFQAI